MRKYNKAKMARVRKGWTQQELADAAGVGLNLIREIENDHVRERRATSLYRLATALDIDIEDLLEDELIVA